jgi:hypothetical protein
MLEDDEQAFREDTEKRQATLWRKSNRTYLNAYTRSCYWRTKEIKKGNPCPPSLLTIGEYRKSLNGPDARSLIGEGVTDYEPNTKMVLEETNNLSREDQYLSIEDQYFYSAYQPLDGSFGVSDTYAPMVLME